MKKQKLFRVIWQSIIFSFVSVFGLAQIVLGQQPGKVTVAVGETKCNKLKKSVNPNSVNRKVSNPAIAKTSFNSNNEVFCVEGLSEGKTRVTFNGAFRESNNNNENNTNGGGFIGGLQQNGNQFNLAIEVTVLPRAERVENADANIFRVQIEQGKYKDLTIGSLLGAEFADPAKNGENWTGIVLTQGNIQIVRGNFVGVNEKVRVTGISQGKTTLKLKGELRKGNVWETVTRNFEVTVTAGTIEPADPWLEAMKRRLEDLKKGAAQAGTDEVKINNSIRYFESFGTLVSAEITKESRLPNPRELREERLSNLRDEATNELVGLRNRFNELSKQIRTIGWHQMLADLKIYLGKKPAQRTFFCPANPNKSSGAVWGTDIYYNGSSLCGAALHKGVITFAGGNITVEFYNGHKDDKYIGSQRNGFSTYSIANSYGYFIFK